MPIYGVRGSGAGANRRLSEDEDGEIGAGQWVRSKPVGDVQNISLCRECQERQSQPTTDDHTPEPLFLLGTLEISTEEGRQERF